MTVLGSNVKGGLLETGVANRLAEPFRGPKFEGVEVGIFCYEVVICADENLEQWGGWGGGDEVGGLFETFFAGGAYDGLSAVLNNFGLEEESALGCEEEAGNKEDFVLVEERKGGFLRR